MSAPLPRASVFVGVSVDGFLARPNHDLDFLPEGGGEEHGYEAFMEGVDTLVIGRNTYDKVLTLGEWPYGAKRVVVLSSRPLEPPLDSLARVARMEGDPKGILERLGAEGARHLYVDGGLTIQAFLRAGLIQRLIVTRVPVLIGAGIPLFGPLDQDLPLRHVATRAFASGLVQTEYALGEARAVPPSPTPAP